jgi:Tfp pilus assembly protein PilO
VSARDRTLLIVVGFIAVLGAFWMLAISPKRKDAADLGTQVSAAHQRLDAAQASATAAQNAKARYDSDYATVARLGKAVPVEDDVPSLVYQLEATAHDNHVDFRKIAVNPSAGATPAPSGAAAAVASANGTTPTASSSSAASTALPPGASVGSAGFPTMPFTFDFQGKFFRMQRFLQAIDDLTSVKGKTIAVKGRLLTVDGLDIKAGPNGFPDIDVTVAATAYLLPADEGLTAGASPTGPGTAVASNSSSSPAPGATATASLHGSN